MSRPTGPPPTTTAVSPLTSPERRTSCTATAVGSTRAACSSDTPSGSATSRSAGTVQRPCIAPGASMPMNTRFMQTWELPAAQAGHSPHDLTGSTVTGSPTDQPSTPAPSAATRPDISWPMTAGRVTRPSMSPWKMCRSVPQMPVKATSTETSPGPGGTSLASLDGEGSSAGVGGCAHDGRGSSGIYGQRHSYDVWPTVDGSVEVPHLGEQGSTAGPPVCPAAVPGRGRSASTSAGSRGRPRCAPGRRRGRPRRTRSSRTTCRRAARW